MSKKFLRNETRNPRGMVERASLKDLLNQKMLHMSSMDPVDGRISAILRFYLLYLCFEFCE